VNVGTNLRRRGTLIQLGLAAGWRGDSRLFLRDGAITISVLIATILLGATWTFPAAFDRPARIETDRMAWPASALEVATPQIVLSSGTTAWFDETQSRWGEHRLTIVQVQADPETPPPPGVDRLPGAGEMVVSPALGELLTGPSRVDLANRLPGTVIGHISRAGLTGPRELRTYIGTELDAMAAPELLGGWGTPDTEGTPQQGGALLLVVFVVAATVVPLQFLLAASLRIYSDRRERRIASLMLLGVPLSELPWLFMGEVLVPVGIGVISGTLLAEPAMSALTTFLPAGYQVFPDDLTTHGIAMVVPVLVILLVAAAGAMSSVRRLHTDSAMNVARQATRMAPRPAWILVPLLGSVMLYLLKERSHEIAQGSLGPTHFMFGALVLIIAGLVPAIRALSHTLARRLAARGLNILMTDLAVMRLAHSPSDTSRLAGVVGLLVLAAVVPQGLFPVLARADNIITADALNNLQADVMFDMVQERIDPQVLADAVDSSNTGIMIRTDIEATDGTATINAWVGSCSDFALLLIEPPANCGSGKLYLVNGLQRNHWRMDSTWRFGIDQTGERRLTDTFTLPTPEVLTVGFPQLLEHGPFVLIPTEALPPAVTESLYADPHRFKQIVTHTAHPEATRDRLWVIPSVPAEYGAVATPEELQQDSTRQLDLYRIIVTGAVAIGIIHALVAVVLASAAHAMEQRQTAAMTWAFGAPLRFGVVSQAIELLIPLGVGIIMGAVLGAIIGTRYLAFAYAGESPPVGLPMLGFDVGGMFTWIGIAVVGSLTAIALALPLTYKNLGVADLRSE